jgi:hypothetical protein
MVSHHLNTFPSMQQASHHTDKVKAQTSEHRGANYAAPPHRQVFHHPRTSYGAAGHWIKTAGILAPLVIGEFIKDPDKKWRAIRIASVATALVSEGMWTHKIHKEREQARERELVCEMSGV